MDKKPIALNLLFDVKSIRKAVALITGEAMSDEEINKKFFDREKVDFDIDKMKGCESEALQISILFVTLILTNDNHPAL